MIVIFLFISILFGGAVYISTLNIYCAIGIFAISMLYFLFIAYPKIKKSKFKNECFHDCYNFINTFVISLSIKKSIKCAYEDTLITMPENFKKINGDLINLNYDEKLNYISTIFPFHIYSLFLNVIAIWSEEGGDILKMSTQLINETKNVEDYLLACERMSKKKYVEFSVLWLITVGILIFLKFALKDFYEQLKAELFFPISICCVFVFILVSIHILLNITTNVELKGWSNNEKKS